MAIFHRIFKKRYKKISARYNNNTKFTAFKVRRARTPIKKMRVLRKKCLPLLYWNALSIKNQKSEAHAIGRDIAVFKKHYTINTDHASQRIDTFRPYLPASVWAKMSKKERSIHLQKRYELSRSGQAPSKQKLTRKKTKMYFTKSAYRPIIKILGFRRRVRYLRGLADRAKLQSIGLSQPICVKHPLKTRPLIAQHLTNVVSTINKPRSTQKYDFLKLVVNKRKQKNAFSR